MLAMIPRPVFHVDPPSTEIGTYAAGLHSNPVTVHRVGGDSIAGNSWDGGKAVVVGAKEEWGGKLWAQAHPGDQADGNLHCTTGITWGYDNDITSQYGATGYSNSQTFTNDGTGAAEA